MPDRNGVFRYLGDVLERQLATLDDGIDAPTSYFYELSIRHEDMHIEALAYTRQTLAYPRPNLGRYQDSKHLHFHVYSGERLKQDGPI